MVTRWKESAIVLALMMLLAACGQPSAEPVSHALPSIVNSQSAAPVTTSPQATVVETTVKTETGFIDTAVDQQIQVLMKEGDIPSLSAAIVVNDALMWAKGYGQQPSLGTVYSVGSIAKTLIATAVLQLVEQGIIDLDSDVNDYILFKVRNPDHPNTAVTVRMLLSHRAGLSHDLPRSRNWDNDRRMLWWLAWNTSDASALKSVLGRQLSLEEFLKESLLPEGEYYGPEVWIAEPGTKYQYSNTGLQLLLPYLVEQVTGLTLAEYVQVNVLEPLKMTSTGYEASQFSGRLAIPHEYVGGKLRALPATGWNASGKLRSTASDLSQFLLMHLGDGRHGEAQILQPETADLMHELVSPLDWPAFFGLHWQGYALGWELYRDGLEGHPGACPGYLANLVMHDSGGGGYGVVLLVNRGASLDTVDWAEKSYAPILAALLGEAERLHAEETGDRS